MAEPVTTSPGRGAATPRARTELDDRDASPDPHGELGEVGELADVAARRFDVVRRLRDVAVDLSTATTRRAVAGVMLRATLEVVGGQVGAVALFPGRGRGRGRRADLLATVPPRDAGRVRALSAAADSIEGLLEPHAALELSSREEVDRAIGEQPATVLGAERMSAYPIVWRSRVRGALLVAVSTRPPMEEIDREFVNAVVVMGAPALERAGRYDIDHEIALKLQRGMMSIPPCDAPETTWSAHYSSAATGLVGGDWYDVIGLDERIGFSIGDIVGRGIDAAVAMGQVRSAGRALANCFDKPHEVIEGLDHFASSTRCGEDSSMAYLTINRHSGELTYAVAGHPPPVVLGPGGTVTWLDGATRALLGRGGKRPSAALRVEPGSTIVLYTDGLVERRGESLDDGMARLVEAAGDLAGADNEARQIVERVGSDGFDDDVAVVVVRYLGAGTS